MGKEQELFLAVREGNIAQVTKIITKVHASRKLSSKKFNINYQNQDGMTFLHQAALSGNMEVMKMLIESGCPIDVKDSKGMKALHYASWQGRDRPVKLLLLNDSRVNEVSHDGNTPLHLAAEHGHTIVAELLIQHGANITIRNKQHKTCLDVACEFGRTKVVEELLLLAPAKELLENSDEDTADNDRTTCLHLASRNGHVEVILLLLQAGIDINRQTLQGTCLHEASKYGKVEVVRLLLDYGVDASRLNSYEQTALEIVNKFTASKAAKALKQILKEACSENPNKPTAGEISYFGSPLLGKNSFSTIRRNHSSGSGGGSKQSEGPEPVFGKNIPTNYNSSLFPSSRTNVASGLDDDVFYNKGGPLSLNSSSSSMTSAFKNQNSLTADQRDSGISSNLSVKALKPLNHFPPSMNSRLPMGLLSIHNDSGLCYDSPHFPANHVHGFANHSHNRVSGGSGGSEGNVSVKSCRPYFPNFNNHNSNNSIDCTPSSNFLSHNLNSNGNNNNSNNNNRLSGQSFESGVSTSSRHSFHSNGSSSGGSGVGRVGGECAGGHNNEEEGGFSSLGNFPDLLAQGRSNADIMQSWLTSMNLEELFHLFKEAGYDMPTISRMTPEDLNAIGITKPNVRKKLKYEISRLNIPDGLPDFIPDSVHDWLEVLNLVQYEQALMSQGYKDINSLLQITWEDLEEIGVTKLGHQKKITLAIDRLKRLLSSSSSPASSSDSLSTPPGHQFFVHPPLFRQGIIPGLPSPHNSVDPHRPLPQNHPCSPHLLNSYGSPYSSSNSSLYATINDCFGRRGSVGSTSGIGQNRNRKSTSGESLERLVELRNLSDFLSGDPAVARFDDLNVWQTQVDGDDKMAGFGRAQNFNPQLRLSAERTFCTSKQLSLFNNFGLKQLRQSPEAVAMGGYHQASSGDSTPTNERKFGPITAATFGKDASFYQDNANNNSSSNDNNDNTINSLLNHYMNSPDGANDDNNNLDNFTALSQGQKSLDVQDHPLIPPSYLYGTDQSERKASDELRDLTFRTGPYASIPQTSSLNLASDFKLVPSPCDLQADRGSKKDQPPPPPLRSNSFRADTRSLFGLVGDNLSQGGRFDLTTDSSIAVLTEEEEEECADEVRGGSGSSSSGEDCDVSGSLRKSNSTASLSSSDGSVGTMDGNTLPFANENVGTIKQRNNSNNINNEGAKLPSDVSDSCCAIDFTDSIIDVANNNSNSGCFDDDNNLNLNFASSEKGQNSDASAVADISSGRNGSNPDKLFNDIDGMLLGLTQELDEMLKLQP